MKIVYFEDKRPECPNCDCEMDDIGSRISKPNKLKGIQKEQYRCPKCEKTHTTSLDPFMSEWQKSIFHYF